MNVTVNSQALAAELRLLCKIVPSRPTIAVISNVLFRADGARDLWAPAHEVSLETSCGARIDEPGVVALPAAKLLALVERFADGDVAIAGDGRTQATVRCGAFTSKLQAFRADDFPAQPKVEGAANVLAGGTLAQLIARTRHAISPTSTMPMLRGALLALTGQVAAMVATDGKRLALAIASCDGTSATAILPTKALDVLSGQLAGLDVTMTIGERHLFFKVGDRLLTSRMVDGTYPSYERVIPRNNDKIATVDRVALAAALRRVEIVSEEHGAVHFALEANRLVLASSSAGIGSADEALAVAYDGSPIRVCANGGYVLDFLDASTEPTVTMALRDPNSAALFTGGADHVGVVMLMKP